MDKYGMSQNPAKRNTHKGLAVSDVSVVAPAKVSLQEWADRVTHASGQAIEAILAVGRLLIDAKKALHRGEWERLFKGHPQAVASPVRFSVATARMYMAIATHPVLSNRNLGNDLPPSWRTLYVLAHIDAPILEAHLAFGRVHPEMTRSEAFVLRDPSCPPPSMRARPSRGGSRRHIACDDLECMAADELRLRNYAMAVHRELAGPLQVGEDGRIVSGVWWLPPVPGRSTPRAAKLAHRCTCPVCGRAHTAPSTKRRLA